MNLVLHLIPYLEEIKFASLEDLNDPDIDMELEELWPFISLLCFGGPQRPAACHREENLRRTMDVWNGLSRDLQAVRHYKYLKMNVEVLKSWAIGCRQIPWRHPTSCGACTATA